MRAPVSEATAFAIRGETSVSEKTVVACVLRTRSTTRLRSFGDGSASGLSPVIGIWFSP